MPSVSPDVGLFDGPSQVASGEAPDLSWLAPADAAVLALIRQVAVPVPLIALQRSPVPPGTVMVLPTACLARPEIRRFLAACPALADRLVLDEAPDAEACGFRLGPFTLAIIRRAAATSDPLGMLARAVPQGEDALLALACRRHGLPFVPLPPTARLAPVGRPRPAQASSGLRSIRFVLKTGETVTVVAVPPRKPDGLLASFAADPPDHSPLVVTTPRRLEAALRTDLAASTLSAVMARLPAMEGRFSAWDIPSWRQVGLVLASAAGLLCAVFDVPAGAAVIACALTGLAFLATGWLRFLATVEYAQGSASVPAPLPDTALPTYTVFAALYGEEAMAGPLIERLAALDYPASRREILILVEADDTATRRAAERAAMGRSDVRVIDVPAGAPRTKPRALAYGLAHARGELVTVYDAEDRPEPDQLRKAAAALVEGPAHLACVQARLVIDRVELPLQRQFAIEYACLFEGLLPWLGRNRMPLPLGGTSNHFKTVALVSVGGWDPWNVTEDADLAIRLYRHGLTTRTLDSATFEEAPARRSVWFRQRVRWIKGWLTSYLVAMRRPLRLYRETGPRGYLGIQVLFAATIGSMMAHPVGLLLAALHLTGVRPLPALDGFAGDLLDAVLLLGVGCGYGANVWLARRVLKARGRPELLRSTWLMPAYWLMISAAAWWAVVDLLRRPHHWAKTPHVAFEARDLRHARTRSDPIGGDAADTP